MVIKHKFKTKIVKEHGCENMIILHYIHNSYTTTATVCDEVYKSLMKMRWQPSLQIVPHCESDQII